MAKTGPNFKLSKTAKRMTALMKSNNADRNQFKRMMIDAEYTASIVPKTSRKERTNFTAPTPSAE